MTERASVFPFLPRIVRLVAKSPVAGEPGGGATSPGSYEGVIFRRRKRWPFSVTLAGGMHPAWQIDVWRGYMRVCLSSRRIYVWWGSR